MTDTLIAGAANQPPFKKPSDRAQEEYARQIGQLRPGDLEQMGIQELLELQGRIHKLLTEKFASKLRDFMK